MKLEGTTNVLFVSCVLMFFFVSSQASCSPGWFGNQCKYKCRCEVNTSCDVNGSCITPNKCEGGWFGPSCQYSDLAYNKGSVAVLTDGNDNTCNDPNAGDGITIRLNELNVFTWLRINVNSHGIDGLRTMSVTFKSGTSSVHCPIWRKYAKRYANKGIQDMHCDLPQTINEMTLTGPAVPYFCSVYVSGGRNMAVKEVAWQPSTYVINVGTNNYVLGPSKAVDGNTNQDLYSLSCTHTNVNGVKWTLTMSRQRSVHRYVIYNRSDAAKQRLAGFSLESFNSGSTSMFTYTDPSTTGDLIYTVVHPPLPVQKIWITINNTEQILTLCEVEVYGDSMCDSRHYGRDCEHSCNCDSNETCFVSTGACPSGCSAGFFGDSCSEKCSVGRYGANCIGTCSAKCAPSGQGNVSSCDDKTGACLRGCQSGYTGAMCADECIVGKFGINCSRSCSLNCVPSGQATVTSCDFRTGACLKGCQIGFSGALCENECSVGTFGINCTESCNPNCATSHQATVSSCNHKTGACLKGCQSGFYGDFCENECIVGKFGINCSRSCSLNCEPSGQATVASCDFRTGACLKGCQIGFSGALCENECSDGTFGIKCTESCNPNCASSHQATVSSCDPKTGACHKGCQSGFYGDFCEDECSDETFGINCTETCSPSCVTSQEANVSSCDPKTGACLEGCQIGFFGDLCEDECSDETFGINCSESCSPNCVASHDATVLSCDINTGACLKGCQIGFYGDMCQDECRVETFGINCNQSCSPNCVTSNQANETSCDTKTGACLKGCQSGFSGDLCSKECSDGTFGINCNQSCSPNCAPSDKADVSSCDTKTGTCLKGCQSGFTGNLCGNKCSVGKFGINCSSSCSPHCAVTGQADVSSCDIKTGACLKGCQSGFSGNLCKEHIPSSSANIANVHTDLLVGLSGLATALFFLAFCLRRKGKPRRSTEGVHFE